MALPSNPEVSDRPDAAATRRLPAGIVITSQLAWRLLVIAAAIVVVAQVLSFLRVVFLPFVFALLLASVLRPPVSWLERHGWRSGLATGAVLLGTVAVLATLFTLTGRRFADEFGNIGPNLQEGWERVQTWLSDSFGVDTDELIDQAGDAMGGSEVGQRVLSGAVTIAEFTVMVLLALFFTFFLAKDGPQLWNGVARLTGRTHEGAVRDAAGRSWGVLSSYLRGIVILAAANAILFGIALLIIGVPLVLPLMFITFIGSLIPFVGPIVAGAAAALVALATGNFADAVWVVVAATAIQQFEGNVLEPIIIGRVMELHPIVIAAAVAAGGVFAGIPGAFLAVPTVAVVIAAIGAVNDRDPHTPPHLPSGAGEPPDGDGGDGDDEMRDGAGARRADEQA